MFIVQAPDHKVHHKMYIDHIFMTWIVASLTDNSRIVNYNS